ncbi:hypothetical protein [Christiangramia flava]|uniref:Uncharacterized protein n=1 Tax=Christiangramia flava JLT2011 TaxID=1229726 RepID=A0A1L7I0H4_9FLAO|nr:hypothetical protein [Christiangramia flava]APU67097.1 hypothetical protein GRFL_0373 [Christiangramia flava JLT2011]OSS38131.1 hypothetical protein C723_3030 [Christiangramia flava JLT2011]
MKFGDKFGALFSLKTGEGPVNMVEIKFWIVPLSPLNYVSKETLKIKTL